MATKKIYVSLSTTGAKATDEVWLSCGSGASIYAQTFSGLTYGWTANPSGVSVVDTSGVASGIYPATTVVAAGSSSLAFANASTASTVNLPSPAKSTRNASSTATSLLWAA